MGAFIRFSSSAPSGTVVKKELLDSSEPIKKLKIDGVDLDDPGCASQGMPTCGSQLRCIRVAVSIVCRRAFDTLPFYQLRRVKATQQLSDTAN